MAIDYNTGISSLEAGAGEITYSGNEGPKSPDQMLMAQADPILVDEYKKYVFEMEEMGQQPMSFKQFMQQAMQGMAYGGSAKPTYTQSRKQQLAGGGIAGLKQIGKPGGLVEPGIMKYGMLDFITEPLEKLKDKFVDDIIPNEIKDNPILSSVVAGTLLNQYGIPGLPGNVAGESMGQNWLGELLSKVPGTGDKTIDMVLGGERGADQIGLGEGLGNIFKTVTGIGDTAAKKEIERIAEGDGRSQALQKIAGVIPDVANKVTTGFKLTDPSTWGGAISNLMAPSKIGDQEVQWKIPLAIGSTMGAIQAAMPKAKLPADTSGIDMAAAKRGDDLRFKPDASVLAANGGRIGYDNGGSTSDRYEAKIKELTDKGLSRELAEALVLSELSPDAYRILEKDGGRIGAQEGGLMDLGGMEKDYRNEGGFVPIGGQERADDVPARLSKNEFVFTADAVRSAGGGDIDKGAEIMENVMENLEQGGQISQESQGLEGARNMFATAQRLEGVL